MTTTLIANLEAVLPKLSTSDRAFAINLITGFKKFGSLTPKQEPWVLKLIERANAPKPEPVYIPVGDFTGVVALFAEARKHLKFPKVVLSLDGQPVWLAVAGAKSKNPGSINIMGEGKYPDRPWFGRVSAAGSFTPAAKLTLDMRDKLVALLVKFGENPARVAKQYGKLTGNCCFCNKSLTDPRSTAAGFGPICAEHYGLSAQWAAAADPGPLKSVEFKALYPNVPTATAAQQQIAVQQAINTDLETMVQWSAEKLEDPEAKADQVAALSQIYPEKTVAELETVLETLTCTVCDEPVGANWMSAEGMTLCTTCASVLTK